MKSLHAFIEDIDGAAKRLGAALTLAPSCVAVHRFPDGEVLPTVRDVARHALLYRALHDPNCKIIEVILTADALRRAGAERLTLIAPYLPYLRQDQIFHAGEPLSRDVILPLLARAFETIITVDPHLHRTQRLENVAPNTHWIVLSGSAAIATALKSEPAAFHCVIGPDAESWQWVEAIAGAFGLPAWCFVKTRHSDRAVSLEEPFGLDVADQNCLLVDDVCASGGTLANAAAALRAAGAKRIEVALTHALYEAATAHALAEAGIARVRSCDGCPHPSNAFNLAPLIAAAIVQEIDP